MCADPSPRRSQEWFGGTGLNGFLHRSWLKNQGTPDRMFDGRPVIGICNTFSDLTPCNAHFRDLAEEVRRGVLEAGGYPVEFPVMSLGETVIRPTTMLYRNLVAMEVEESIRANPVDGVVLLCGCDKTTPALLMGAASCDLPTIVVSGGPMLSGRFRGEIVGSGTSAFAMSEANRAGRVTDCEFRSLEAASARSPGHCNTMGTASTMASLVEALGMSLSGNAAIPAVDARRRLLARDSGVRAVELVHADVRPGDVLTRAAFENAITVNAAIGGSTNAVLHLLALAGRVGVPLTLDDFETVSRGVPLLVDLMPAGRFLMEDLFYAGGLPAVLRELGDRLHDVATVAGRTMHELVADAQCWDREVVRTVREPVQTNAGIAVLHGNLAPDGAVIKPAAASAHLLHHIGPAIVFDSMDELRAAVDDPDLDVTADSVLVLRNAGPRGYPGMPELGNLPLPAKLLAAGVEDMVRISDARMSGTAYGTVVLHVAPEAAAGGPLALVRTGDRIEIDVAAGRLELLVDDDELTTRASVEVAARPRHTGYTGLYVEHVLQADRGADFDFLVGRRGSQVVGDNH